ncbi:uncharacterized protein LOC118645841 isoform X2 [Monomorium pharaonis]|uniref:uncharacterized protein LOC118645841 isoform X2 n=1 Tax=Monomorium pharaonis TaxID=307658 RepID=UPI0017469939|nr:uncharacterized protein LOC118645841 isoform X2 [Monomorium pharaonis]
MFKIRGVWLLHMANGGNQSNKSNRSVFRVPKDVEQLKQWVAAIPGIVKLKHVICDKHFEGQYIIREWIKRDESSRIIAQAPYKYPQLSKLAVPIKLLNDKAVDLLTESSLHVVSPVFNSVYHDGTTSVRSPVSIEVSNHQTENDSADASNKSLNTSRQVDISSTSITDTPHVQDVSCI